MTSYYFPFSLLDVHAVMPKTNLATMRCALVLGRDGRNSSRRTGGEPDEWKSLVRTKFVGGSVVGRIEQLHPDESTVAIYVKSVRRA